MIDTRLMDLSGTRAGEIVLFARVSQVMASPDGVHDLQAAFMRGRQRRAVRLHSSERCASRCTTGTPFSCAAWWTRPPREAPPGVRPSALRVEHTHANTFDARAVFDALRGRKD